MDKKPKIPKQAQPKVEEMSNAEFTGILIAIVVVVVTILLFILWRKRRSYRNGVLLMGLSDSGKTLIFSNLIYQKYSETHTSMKENIGNYGINNKTLNIIDIPGQERLRIRFFDRFKHTAKGIVYVIDSSTVQKEIRDVAEFLYSLLTDEFIYQNGINLLVLCHKQDETMAKGANIIRGLLEKEINTLRLTQSSQLESVDSKDIKKRFLGKEGKDFEFSHLPFNVEFVETTAVSKDSDAPPEFGSLKKWLENLA